MEPTDTQAPEVGLTQWFTRHTNPTEPGPYRAARNATKEFSYGWAYWNGTHWERYGNWGIYHTAPDFVWQGLSGPSTDEKWHAPA